MVTHPKSLFTAFWLFVFSALLASCGGGGSSSNGLTADARSATSKIDPSEPCRTLFAGQTIDVGTVCLETDAHFLYITYETTGGWLLNEVHLFVGESLDDMPQTNNGSPIPGQFPYVAEDLETDTFQFKIPLDDLTAECGDLVALAAHAVVSKTDGDSTQEETAWADGDNIVRRGNWATWSEYLIDCEDDDPPPPVCPGAETAYGVGDKTFEELGFGNWGWQITVLPGDDNSVDLYAGAAQHDLSKGTHVGTVSYTYDGSVLHLTYETFEGFGLLEAHVYAGAEELPTNAPGLFGNTQEPLEPTSMLDFTVPVEADPLYVAVHAVVVGTDCEPEEEDPPAEETEQ